MSSRGWEAQNQPRVGGRNMFEVNMLYCCSLVGHVWLRLFLSWGQPIWAWPTGVRIDCEMPFVPVWMLVFPLPTLPFFRNELHAAAIRTGDLPPGTRSQAATYYTPPTTHHPPPIAQLTHLFCDAARILVLYNNNTTFINHQQHGKYSCSSLVIHISRPCRSLVD